jgi:MFS transporter, DHA1 family, multidrug resistance protein
MYDTVQDSAFGRLLHAISGGRLFGWDDSYTSIVKETASTSSETLPVPTPTHSTEYVEKGPDYELVNWLENDKANPRNWSTPKKVFVTGLICFLTTSVYIGSAIYTAGLEEIMADFGVSRVAALLGLTLFVAGYGLGPMVWVSLFHTYTSLPR